MTKLPSLKLVKLVPKGGLKHMTPTISLPASLTKRNIPVPKLSTRLSTLKQTRFSKLNLLAFALIFGGIGAYALLQSHAAGPAVWVSATGNDSTCVRNDSSKPCLTLAKACRISLAGDIVGIFPGNYPSQQIQSSDCPDVAPAATFQSTTGNASDVVIGGTSGTTPTSSLDLETGSTHFGAPSWVTFTKISFNGDILVRGGASPGTLSSAGTHITFDGIKGGGVSFACVQSFLMQNSDFGPSQNDAVSSRTTAADGQIIDENPIGSCISGDATIQNNTIHDFTVGSSSSHFECIRLADIATITIQSNWIYNCQLADIDLEPHVTPTSWVIQNNWFGKTSNFDGSARNEGIRIETAAQGNTLIRYNSFASGQGVMPAPASNAGTSTDRIIGNIFGVSSGWAGPTWDHNIFQGGTYGTNSASVSDVGTLYSNPDTGAAGDYHLINGTNLAVGFVPNSGSDYNLATDKDGNARSFPAAAGADEYISPVNVWVSTTGNDSTCVRGDQTKPCLTLNKAFSIASCGDTVQVAAGTYASQTISSTKACTSTTQVKFVPSAGAQPVFNDVTVQTSYVWIEGMKVPHSLTGTTVGDWSVEAPSNQLPSAASYVTLKNDEGGSLYVVGEHVDVLGGSYGGFSACLTGEEDLTRIWQQPDSVGTYHASSYVTFDGVTIHDGTDNGGDCGDPVNGPHVDALQILGGHHITIQNSFFYNCPTSCIIGSGFRTGEDNYLIQNNFLQEEANPGATLNFGYVANGDPQTGSNMVIRYNTTNGTISAGCVAGSSGCWDVYGNILSHASYCGGYMSTWEYNVVGDNSCGGNNNKICNPSFIGPTPQSSYGSSTIPDFRLNSGDTCAKDYIPTAAMAYPATDRYGTARPQNTLLDAGAYELNAGGAPDTTAPSVPSGLTISGKTANSISISWTASTDNVGIAGYHLYKGTTLDGTTTNLTYTFSGLSCGTTYSNLGLTAFDAAGNNSDVNQAIVDPTITSSCPTSPPPSPPPAPTPKKGDCNGDNLVNLTDLSILLSHYNTNYSPADFDANSLVSLADLSILLSNYGR